MTTVIEALREVLGLPIELTDYPQLLPYVGLFEYILAGLLVLVVVASIFKLLINWAKN